MQHVSQEKEVRSLRQQLLDFQVQSDEKTIIGKYCYLPLEGQVTMATVARLPCPEWWENQQRLSRACAEGIRAVLPEPSLFTHLKYGSRRPDQKSTSSPTGWLLLARLKNEFTEDGNHYHDMAQIPKIVIDRSKNKFSMFRFKFHNNDCSYLNTYRKITSPHRSTTS